MVDKIRINEEKWIYLSIDQHLFTFDHIYHSFIYIDQSLITFIIHLSHLFTFFNYLLFLKYIDTSSNQIYLFKSHQDKFYQIDNLIHFHRNLNINISEKEEFSLFNNVIQTRDRNSKGDSHTISIH